MIFVNAALITEIVVDIDAAAGDVDEADPERPARCAST